MVAESDIQQMARIIAEEFRPQRIILFGSRAGGQPRDDSDVDLLVVMSHRGAAYVQAAEIRASLTLDAAIDIVVRSPEEVERRYALRDPIVRAALDEGRVLYTAAA